MSTQQTKVSNANMVALLILHAVLDAIDTAGDDGAPDGVIYAALNTFGASLDQHQRLMGLLAEQGLVTQSDHLLRLTADGRKALSNLAALAS